MAFNVEKAATRYQKQLTRQRERYANDKVYRETIKAYKRAWRAEHRESCRESCKRYYAKKKAARAAADENNAER